VGNGALIGLIVGGAVLVLVVIALAAKKSAKPKQQKICGGCRRVMLPVWTKCLFCGWAPVARLEFILGPMANQTLPLSEEVTTIGSVAGNTVVLAQARGYSQARLELRARGPRLDQWRLRQRPQGAEEDARARRHHSRRQHRSGVQARVGVSSAAPSPDRFLVGKPSPNR
jgi:hypothetical protein